MLFSGGVVRSSSGAFPPPEKSSVTHHARHCGRDA